MSSALHHLDLSSVLFLDIETVSGSASYDELDAEWQKLWEEKTRWQRKDEFTPEEYYPQRAGILAEFGKVVCVSLGVFERAHGQGRVFRLKSVYGSNELELLQELAHILNKNPDYRLCAHNGKEFDFPYLCRRYLINGLDLPKVLDIQGKKPWEIHHLDTMELWKFGDGKHFTSLKLMAKVLGIPSPKDDIDGSQVGSVFWKEGDLERIAHYCEKDTLTLAQILLRMRQEPILDESEIKKV